MGCCLCQNSDVWPDIHNYHDGYIYAYQNPLYVFVAAWVVRSKAAPVRYFWITHSCLI